MFLVWLALLDPTCVSKFCHGYLRIIIYTHALESRCALCHYTYKFNRAWHFTPFAIADFVLQRSHWKSFAKFLRLVSFCKFYIPILIRYSSGDQTCIECNNEAYTTIVDNLWIVEKQQKITNNIQIFDVFQLLKIFLLYS